MDSVYNRKLFQRKEDRAARDQLRKMGGIMSSSEDLMQVVQQGFRPSQDPQMTGQGEVVSMAPSIVPSAQDMMAMQQQRPPQQMQQRPPQPPMAQPMGQPPQMQTSVQAPPQMQSPQQPMQRRGFQQGGVAQMSPEQMAEYRNSRLLTGARSVDAPTMSRPTITEGGPAAPVTVTEAPTTPGPDTTAPSSPAEALEKAKVLIEDPQIPAEEKAKAIVQASGEPSSGDVLQDIRALYQQSVGGEIPRDATIDELNRGIFGAVMAQSKNPRAAGAFAEGLAAALGAMRETEMGRQDREMNLKGTEFQVRAGREEAAMRAAASGSTSTKMPPAIEGAFKIYSEQVKNNRSPDEAYKVVAQSFPGADVALREWFTTSLGTAVPTMDQLPSSPGGATNAQPVPPGSDGTSVSPAQALTTRIGQLNEAVANGDVSAEDAARIYQEFVKYGQQYGVSRDQLPSLSIPAGR
jgi:hypothetical protein